MRGRTTAVTGVLAIAALALGACTSGGPRTPAPLASTTPPAVERTVAAGTTLHGQDAGQGHTMADGSTMTGMAMPGMAMPSTVPNGTGPHAVAAPHVDGCNRAYGRTAQCVPTHAPGGGPVTCAFLETYGYLPMQVNADPLGLLAEPTTTVRVHHGKRYLVAC